ncbi:MAG: hypothetical protein ACPIOQ_50405, partial [Promethearchaeia archaeon]
KHHRLLRGCACHQQYLVIIFVDNRMAACSCVLCMYQDDIDDLIGIAKACGIGLRGGSLSAHAHELRLQGFLLPLHLYMYMCFYIHAV